MQSYRLLLGCLLAFGLVVEVTFPAVSTGCVQSQTPRLTIARQSGLLETGTGAVRYEIGQVDPFETPDVERTFILRNASNSPLVIERVQSSCGCTTALVGNVKQSTSAVAMPAVAPGADLPLKVNLSVTHLNSGFTNKFVWVYAKGDVRPTVTIELTADIKANVSFSPEVLDFGRRQAGTAHSVTLTASIDNRLLKGLPEPQLACSNPDIIVPSRPASVQCLTVDGRSVSHFTFLVGISPKSRLGMLTGNVSFFLTVPAQTPSVKTAAAADSPQTRAATLITAPTVPLSGEVVGKIAASPGTVVFGNVRAGTEIVREIAITGENADVLKELHLASGSPKITAELKPQVPVAGQKPNTLLVVRMKPDGLPAGAFQSQVTVETSDGQRLLLPILAYLGAP